MKKILILLLLLPLFCFSQTSLVSLENKLCYYNTKTNEPYDCDKIKYNNTEFAFDKHYRFVIITHHKENNSFFFKINNVHEDKDGGIWISLEHDNEFLLYLTDDGIITIIIDEDEKEESFICFYTDFIKL